MANKSLFSTQKNQVPVADTVNRAGGKAYSIDAKNALAQYTCTSTLNGTYYTSGQTQLEELKGIVKECESSFLAKAAVYGRKKGKMKDLPAYILAELTARNEHDLLREVFGQVINNTKMLRNYVQIVRSGVLGRKSLGSMPRNLVQTWLNNRNLDDLFYDSVGDSPSLGDVIKLAHPRPQNKSQEALYRYLIGKDIKNKRNLPTLLRSFEDFKAGLTTEVPAVDFRRLTALNLTTEQWIQIGYNAGWNMIRMNLNTFERHGCFKDTDFVKFVASKLSNKEEVLRSMVFPYQLFTAYLNIKDEIPSSIKNALQEAMEVSIQNVPNLEQRVVVCVDSSGSMSSPITGHNGSATSKMRCVDVAGLIASSIVRVNKESMVLPFDTSVHQVSFNPYDSVITNARIFARNGGGTDCSCALRHLNQHNHKADLVIYVSDNESWYDNNTSPYSYRGTGMAKEWNDFKKKNKQAKMICIDLIANRTVQQPNNKDVLNVGGFSNEVYNVIKNFTSGDSSDFATIIENWYQNPNQISEKGLDTEEE